MHALTAFFSCMGSRRLHAEIEKNPTQEGRGEYKGAFLLGRWEKSKISRFHLAFKTIFNIAEWLLAVAMR